VVLIGCCMPCLRKFSCLSYARAYLWEKSSPDVKSNSNLCVPDEKYWSRSLGSAPKMGETWNPLLITSCHKSKKQSTNQSTSYQSNQTSINLINSIGILIKKISSIYHYSSPIMRSFIIILSFILTYHEINHSLLNHSINQSNQLYWDFDQISLSVYHWHSAMMRPIIISLSLTLTYHEVNHHHLIKHQKNHQLTWSIKHHKDKLNISSVMVSSHTKQWNSIHHLGRNIDSLFSRDKLFSIN
jgi:hypothetical protein